MSNHRSDPILGFRKPPILLLGSGITLRYAKDAPDWMGLLERVAGRMGIDRHGLAPYVYEAQHGCGPAGVMPRLATDLRKEFNDRVKAGTIDIAEALDEDELRAYYDLEAGPVKILAATECRRLAVDEESPLASEIALLRRLPDIIPCVITTNYDTMIEDGLFGGRFKVYSRVPDYYLSGSQGIGEIYKIHGTCTDPSTMILEEDDYVRFREQGKIIAAKMLSVLCDYPLLIMGYSMEDRDVIRILEDLISSLDDEKLQEVGRNIVLISYDPDEAGIVPITMVVKNGEHSLTFRAYKTGDFAPILEELASMEASVSPDTIRRIRKVTRRIQITEGSSGRRYKAIGIDDIREEDSDRLVVVITDRENLRSLENIPPVSVDGMIRDVLGLSPFKGDPDMLVNIFLRHGSKMFGDDEYVPIFHYMNLMGPENIPDSPFLRSYVDRKEGQFRRRIDSLHLPRSYNEEKLRTVEDIERWIDGVKTYLKPIIVILLYDSGRLTEEQSLGILRRIYDEEDSMKNNSMVRCAVTYLGFKRYRMWQGPKDAP